MQFAGSDWLALVGHSSTSGDCLHGIDARAEIGESGIGMFHYVLRADMSRVRIPPERPPDRADDLWKHTCFEAFIGAPGAARYCELNFAPSRQWAAYCFTAYRQERSSADFLHPPEISVRRFADRLELDAAVSMRAFIVAQGVPSLRIGLNAVLEDENGTLSYWALKHPQGKADFHRPEGFVLELDVESGHRFPRNTP